MDKVLLVEDEDIIRRGLLYAVDWLKEDCVVVGEAMDGIDGLEKIDTLRPDIVITDVKMPYLDGLGTRDLSRCHGVFAEARGLRCASREPCTCEGTPAPEGRDTAAGAGICRICTSGDFSIGGGTRRQIYGKTPAPHSRGLCRATVAAGYCRRVWSVRGLSAAVLQTGYEVHR